MGSGSVNMGDAIPPDSIRAYFDGCQFIVTTPNDVYSWSTNGVQEIFHTNSSGILAAKRTLNRRNLLAVSDSRVVVLHDLDNATTNSYRLRGTKGQIRTMHYDEASHRLFFTTKLQDAVQCFSLERGELLRPATVHPSPPTTFAFSSNLDVVLSASAKPPLILLTSISGKVPASVVKTELSKSPVAAAAFQSGLRNRFALSFLDGTVAVFEIYKHGGQRGSYQGSNGFEVREICHVTGLHQFDFTAVPGLKDDSSADSTTSDDPKREGKFSIEFLPGTRLTILSTGPDGKCCVIDAKPLAIIGDSMRVRTSWAIGAPATSLVIATLGPQSAFGAFDGLDEHSEPGKAFLIAVGRVDGVISFFDLHGRLLAEAAVPRPCPIINIEWIATKAKFQSSITLDGTMQTANDHLVPSAEKHATAHSPAKSAYYTPLGGSPARRIQLQTTEVGALKNRLRKPQIPARTRCRPIRSSAAASGRGSFANKGHGHPSSGKAPPVPPRPKMHRQRQPGSQHAETKHRSNRSAGLGPSHSPGESISKLSLENRRLKDDKEHGTSPVIKGPDSQPIRKPRTPSESPPSTESDETVLAWDHPNPQPMPWVPKLTRPPPTRSGKYADPRTASQSHPLEAQKSYTQHPGSGIKPSSNSSQYRVSFFRPRPGATFPGQAGDSDTSSAGETDSAQAADGPSPFSPLEREARGVGMPQAAESKVAEPRERTLDVDLASVRILLKETLIELREEIGSQFKEQRVYFGNLLRDQREQQITQLEQRKKVLKLELYGLRDKKPKNGKAKA